VNKPHGGNLVDLIDNKNVYDKYKKLLAEKKLPSLVLNDRQLCDFEMLTNGAFSPLTGFMNQSTYESVCEDMRLPGSNLIWPMPIVLDVSEDLAKQLYKEKELLLEDQEGVLLGVLRIEDVYQPDKLKEAGNVFGTTDLAHPGVNYLLNIAKSHYVGGAVLAFSMPHHYDFLEHRNSPIETRQLFEKMGWKKIIAFQTRNPMHRAHVELVLKASEDIAANVMIHPVVGLTKPGDVDHYTRVRSYRAVIDKFPSSTATLSLLPLAMRMGGPREAVWHAIIRKNYGCTHFIVGRDHAGPGKNSNGEDFYGPYEAQELVEKHADEIGIEVVPFKLMVYATKRDKYVSIDELEENEEHKTLSGTELRGLLNDGKNLPEWFTYPEVAEILKETYRPLNSRGLTVFFTGLSGSGKSTLAKGLISKLNEIGDRTVTLLDGDEVRRHLSSELGFSEEHRNLNVTRIGYVASEISKHGGIAVCAPIAPYDATRRQVRNMIELTSAGFLLVHVNTPVEVCEQRDRKGLYAAARSGKIKNFTGVSDPYENPNDADLTLDTSNKPREELVQSILLKIEQKGYL